MEHGVIMSNHDQIEARHLPTFVLEPNQRGQQLSSQNNDEQKNLAPTTELNLHALEQLTIQKALRQTDGNKTKAASILGISRRTLQRKLSEPTTGDH